ncbi:dephospho-CoA kinase [Aequorivita sp. H23M31]|uniref:Dephospho-CoA kinase n=1 Tax=Aequorivita ciconiae TaxID=2494375 RepID=A0A410FZE8_9FLAO|nr:dephospho-CoA kinase [Aequorivita sp. H23M31]QAA80398.1 dephospho-CoA kinase [Aequorivita sp. H23M31]
MKIIGLTGGIGSGKTTVANMFAELGIPVYNSDVEAKKLTNSSSEIRSQLISLLGDDTYKNGMLDRKYMADKIFNDHILLEKANAIIHPRVAEHFAEWVSQQTSPYVIKEAAILFESGADSQCDLVILVTAAKAERLKRVMDRDGVSEQEVEARMKNQWSDSKKTKLADFIIENNTLSHTRKQVKSVHSSLI